MGTAVGAGFPWSVLTTNPPLLLCPLFSAGGNNSRNKKKMENILSFFLGPFEPPVFLALLAVIFGGAFITSGFGVGGAC